jgi:hypothetical protein
VVLSLLVIAPATAEAQQAALPIIAVLKNNRV